jgi:hypothetical protein
MKDHNLFYLLIAYIAITTSCSKTSDNNIVQSSDIKSINVIVEDTPYSQYTLFPQDAVIISDTILVVYEPKIKDGFISVYNENNHTKIAQLGAYGSAPDQFLNPRPLFDIDLSNDKFYIADLSGIYSFDPKCENYSQPKGAIVDKIPDEFKLFNYLLSDNDSLMVCNQTGCHQLTIYNKVNQSINYRDFFPNNTDLQTNELVNNMNVYESCYTCSNDNVAIAYHNWKQIDIYNIRTGDLKSIKFDDYLFNKEYMGFDTNSQIIEISEDAKIYFTNIKSTDNYIYAICWDNTIEKISKAQATPIVYQLDWNGNVLAKYNFDHPIANICIYKDKIKYAMGILDDGEMHILKCKYSN